MNISAEDLSIKVDAQENLIEMKEKASYLDKLTYLMKEKIYNCCRDKEIQLLTMTPSSWSVRKAKGFLMFLLML